MKSPSRISSPRSAIAAVTAMLYLTSQAGAQTPPPRKVASVEGITEYRLDNGLQVLLFPDSVASQGHRQPDGLRRLAARGLRRDGHGPPARAHGLQGDARPIPTSPAP